MSATLTAHLGRALRGEYPLSKSAIRVGSLPLCDVQIPELEPHAITIECRDGRHFAHNKTQRELLLGNIPLMPGKSREWPEGVRLQIRRDLCLAIRAEAPTRKERAKAQAEERAAGVASPRSSSVDFPGDADGPSGLGRTASLLTLAVACLVAAGWIVGAGPGAITGTDETIARLIGALQRGGVVEQAVALELQLASEGEWLGRGKESRVHLVRARTLLAGDDPAAGGTDTPGTRARRETLRFLSDRLR